MGQGDHNERERNGSTGESKQEGASTAAREGESGNQLIEDTRQREGERERRKKVGSGDGGD